MGMNKRYLKWILIPLAVLVSLILILYLVLQLSSVQNYIKDKILASLSKTYQAEWSIGNLSIDFFDNISASDILFLDQQNDTLLKADQLDIDIGLFQLIGRNIVIDEVRG